MHKWIPGGTQGNKSNVSHKSISFVAKQAHLFQMLAHFLILSGAFPHWDLDVFFIYQYYSATSSETML